ncbi:glycerate kinase [Oceanobacillus piezotolerans]|uniref:Glycerate kinase n=1 Tax=Oceanobacillus piezotolerans TaxID=2448030 RepID=A0A498DJ51_9BACI|nr:glycerate kinase [Oceanobacillus piezotolerans]RLL46462.1 glycerate kinase [Oceanobacillus piezotolerans]
MNIILAPDSFKGSLTALEAAETMREAILDVNESHHVIMKPMADGGEGTLDVMLASAEGKRVTVSCTGPLGEKIQTSYGILESKQAVIELASIAGLTQVPISKRDPDHTTTLGVGEVIRDAINRNCTSIVIGLGGSATNDGGLGMLIALGMKAWDEKGNLLTGFGKDLQQVRKLSFKEMDPRLHGIDIKVASDVDNPLCGSRGASYVFGPQKGASPTQVSQYDKALSHYAHLIETTVNKSWRGVPGSGAAGGVGFALLAIGADLVSGANLLASTLLLEEDIKQADLVITGEGQSDVQTLYGKAPGHVAFLANKYDIPVVLISGSLGGELDRLRERFSGCFSIINKPITLGECISQAKTLLYEQTKQIIHFAESLY